MQEVTGELQRNVTSPTSSGVFLRKKRGKDTARELGCQGSFIYPDFYLCSTANKTTPISHLKLLYRTNGSQSLAKFSH